MPITVKMSDPAHNAPISINELAKMPLGTVARLADAKGDATVRFVVIGHGGVLAVYPAVGDKEATVCFFNQYCSARVFIVTSQKVTITIE